MLRRGLVVARWAGAEILHHPDHVIDRIVRQFRIASATYGVPVLLPGGCLRALGALSVANGNGHAAYR